MTNSPQPTVLLLDDEVMVATTLQSLLQLETAYRVLSFTDPDDPEMRRVVRMLREHRA